VYWKDGLLLQTNIFHLAFELIISRLSSHTEELMLLVNGIKAGNFFFVSVDYWIFVTVTTSLPQIKSSVINPE